MNNNTFALTVHIEETGQVRASTQDNSLHYVTANQYDYNASLDGVAARCAEAVSGLIKAVMLQAVTRPTNTEQR